MEHPQIIYRTVVWATYWLYLNSIMYILYFNMFSSLCFWNLSREIDVILALKKKNEAPARYSLYVFAAIYLLRLLLMDVWVFCRFLLLQRCSGCSCICPSGQVREALLTLDTPKQSCCSEGCSPPRHLAVANLLRKVITPIYTLTISAGWGGGVPLRAHLCRHLTLSVFLILANLKAVKRSCRLLLLCISLLRSLGTLYTGPWPFSEFPVYNPLPIFPPDLLAIFFLLL